MAYQYYKPSFANIQEPVYDLPLELIMQQGNQMQETYYKNKSIEPGLGSFTKNLPALPEDMQDQQDYIKEEFTDKISKLKETYDMTDPQFGMQATAIINGIAQDKYIREWGNRLKKYEAWKPKADDPLNYSEDYDWHKKKLFTKDESGSRIMTGSPDGHLAAKVEPLPYIAEAFGKLNPILQSLGVRTIKGNKIGSSLDVLWQEDGITPTAVTNQAKAAYHNLIVSPHWQQVLRQNKIYGIENQRQWTSNLLNEYGKQQIRNDVKVYPLNNGEKKSRSGSGSDDEEQFTPDILPNFQSLTNTAVENKPAIEIKSVIDAYKGVGFTKQETDFAKAQVDRGSWARNAREYQPANNSNENSPVNWSNSHLVLNRLNSNQLRVFKHGLTQAHKANPDDEMIGNMLNRFDNSVKNHTGFTPVEVKHFEEVATKNANIINANSVYQTAVTDIAAAKSEGIITQDVKDKFGKIVPTKLQAAWDKHKLGVGEDGFADANRLASLLDGNEVWDLDNNVRLNTAEEKLDALNEKATNKPKDGTYASKYQASYLGKLNSSSNYFATGDNLALSNAEVYKIGGKTFAVINHNDYQTPAKKNLKEANDINALVSETLSFGGSKNVGKSGTTPVEFSDNNGKLSLNFGGQKAEYDVNKTFVDEEGHNRPDSPVRVTVSDKSGNSQTLYLLSSEYEKNDRLQHYVENGGGVAEEVPLVNIGFWLAGRKKE